MTVSLRRFRLPDLPWLEAWLPAAAGRPAHELRPWLASLSARVIVRDGVDAGLIAWRAHHPAHGSAVIEIVATPSEHARRGTGMAAAALAEAALRRDGVRTVYAPAPAARGIAMYFWIRLGYRPLLRPAWPCATAGVAWLSRAI
ncbi:MAG TPA: hypothetical protein VEZ14_08690 [Dehalococcoidia bacterium]|nr:hypothetical protein [Dehalococcoidia bacterium]